MIGFTLSSYLAQRFTRTILAAFAGVFALIFTIDLVETLRKSGETAEATGLTMTWLSLLHTPLVAEQALPFVVLFGAMAAFLNLSRKLELVVARAAGVSVWQLLAPPLAVVLVIGVISVTLYNPLSAFMKRQADELESRLFGHAGETDAAGLWVRQKSVDGQAIIRAETVANSGATLNHVTVFEFDDQGRFVQRVDAARASLEQRYWRLNDAHVVTPGFETQNSSLYLLATNLTRREVT